MARSDAGPGFPAGRCSLPRAVERRLGLHRRGPSGKGWRESLAGSGPLPADSLPVRIGPVVRLSCHGLPFPLPALLRHPHRLGASG